MNFLFFTRQSVAAAAGFMTLFSLASCHCDHDEPATFNKGHILCSDGTVMSLCDFTKSRKEAVGIVYQVETDPEKDILGYAVYVKECPNLAFADSCGVAQNTSASLSEADGNTNTYSIYTTNGVSSPMANYVFDLWPYGQSAYIPSIEELRRLFAVKDFVNQRIVAVGGDPISDDDADCWIWSSTEVEGQEANKAWLFSMNYGDIVETPKNQPHKVRPVITIRK